MISQQAVFNRSISFVFACLIVFAGCDGTVNEPLPDAPRQVHPEKGADRETSATELQWNATASASFYHVQVSERSDFEQLYIEDDYVVSASYPMSNLEVGKSYFWRIPAGNDEGFGQWSAAWDFKTARQGVIPPIPKLTLPADGVLDQPTQINFNWSPVDGATTYHIQVSLEENFVRRSADVEGVRGTSALIRGLVPTYIYYWRVRSENPLGFSSWSPTRFLVIEDDL